MAWFSRKGSGSYEGVTTAQDEDDGVEPELPLRPRIERIGVEEQQCIASGRASIEASGLDVDDLAAMGAAFDSDLAGWLDVRKSKRGDEKDIVEKFAVAIGDHLARRTDLRWARVTDAFGTDLAVAGGSDEFVVVPQNLVAARWMNSESGWLPGGGAHLVRVRDSR
ncbi:MAG: DUF3806 domain-containing protein [Actinomycetota bacterium]|nr:DUF3806 domain-containing protein [Actinomycetota bacterium]